MQKRKPDDFTNADDDMQLPSSWVFLVHCALFAIYSVLAGGLPETTLQLIISGVWSLALFIHGIVLFQRHTLYQMNRRGYGSAKRKRKRHSLSDEEQANEEVLLDLYAEEEQREDLWG